MSHQVGLDTAARKIDMLARHLKDHFEEDANNSESDLPSIRRDVFLISR
jgi:hypothetical protein